MAEIGALLTDGTAWASLFTLVLLEVVLGIDNLVFLSIMTNRLPPKQAKRARRVGLLLAMCGRIALLTGISWIISLRDPVFALWGEVFSWRDLVMIGGGLFLLVKGTSEIHSTVEGDEENAAPSKSGGLFLLVILQIFFMDLIFSFDSVLTAVGMAEHLPVMIAAVVLAIGIMMVAAEPLSAFIANHPTVKMLALSFILLIGLTLIADGLQFHIPRGYLYFAISFSLGVEILNILARKNRKPSPEESERRL